MIGGGRNHTMSGISTEDSVIIGGSGNTMDSGVGDFQHRNAIVGGGNLVMSSRTQDAFMGGGQNNALASRYASIIGGTDSLVKGLRASVIGGEGAYIGNSANSSAIVGGKNSYIVSKYSFIGAGLNNSISGNSSYSTMIGGRYNTINTDTESTIGGGRGNTISPGIGSGGNRNFIGNGYSNYITNTTSSIIGNGFQNGMVKVGIGDPATFNVIANGLNNRLYEECKYTSIVNGYNNVVQDSNHSIIGAGRDNYISSNYSAILNGIDNTISGGTFTSAYNAIIGGRGHTVTSAKTSVIIAGTGHTISKDVEGAVILGGNDITATVSKMVYVPDLTIDGLTSTDPIATDVNGKIVAGTSDRRLKKNIVSLTSALDKVKKLKGVSFEYTKESNMGDGIRFGFIAQDVQEIIPEMVRERAKGDGMLSLSYTEVIPWLVEAVKELGSEDGPLYRREELILETQTIAAEDNNIELNYGGTPETALGGGIKVLHALGQDKHARLVVDGKGRWIANALATAQLTLPEYTPVSSADPLGGSGDVVWDDLYLYIRTNEGWRRSSLELF